jgi:hypothetical protein
LPALSFPDAKRIDQSIFPKDGIHEDFIIGASLDDIFRAGGQGTFRNPVA